ncbi:MAG: cell division protein ZapE [Woeseiaceae bacterium]|nr:cell division protein ZapE [Woeseiaceae bacterium]NIP22010.1 cell division protein ZapE [Woeseiaceae bacterium]NIS91134.1 cell division protein ZapE [Woeseiaceae bacterium]
MRITGILTIREAYEASLRSHGHEQDPAQLEIVDHLEGLRRQLHSRRPKRGFARLFQRSATTKDSAVKGLYIWGGVGRGKTFLMDIFFEALDIEHKKRIHFHRIMREVHERLNLLGDTEDPLDKVAADIARETRVLCFDEFFVSDIGDAMILGRLLDGLFRRGVTLVATSNAHPDDLYKDGLQRQRFLPAIQSLIEHTAVVEIDGATDYRLRLLQQAGTYISPDDENARERLQHVFDDSASSQIVRDTTLDVNGRDVRVRLCAKGIAWFEFEDLCDGPRSHNDYIEIARWYPTVIVSGVPALDHDLEDQARRFIALVDEFYDRRVKLILSAAAPAASLYSGGKLQFEFDRTVSRLTEMQSTDYLAAPHLA